MKTEGTEVKPWLQIKLRRPEVLSWQWWLGDEGPQRLRVFESVLVCAFLVMLGYNFLEWRDWLTPEAFHLTNEEAVAMGYPPIFPQMPAGWVPWFGMLILVAGAGVVACRWRRVSLLVLAVVAVYVQGVDYPSTSAQNKLCIVVLVMLATAPGLLQVEGVRVANLAPIRAIQALLLIEYWAAGWTKAFGEGAWLQHADTLQLTLQGMHRTELAALLLRTLPSWVWTVAQVGTLIFEIGAPIWFCWRRTRWLAIIAGCGLHLGIAVMMNRVGFFSLQMVSFYPLFVRPEEWRRLGAWLRGVKG